MTGFPKPFRTTGVSRDRRHGLHHWVSEGFRIFGGPPCFQVYGKAEYESDFHIIDIYATDRRNSDSRLPLFRGTCITWTSSVIAVGCDFARELLEEQRCDPATPSSPVRVESGRLNDWNRRHDAGHLWFPSASEIMAHECGHTGQARRMGGLYWLIGALVTQFREGNHFWNHFENQASETGLFGGIVPGSLDVAVR